MADSTFTFSAPANTDVWKKPPSHDVFTGNLLHHISMMQTTNSPFSIQPPTNPSPKTPSPSSNPPPSHSPQHTPTNSTKPASSSSSPSPPSRASGSRPASSTSTANLASPPSAATTGPTGASPTPLPPRRSRPGARPSPFWSRGWMPMMGRACGCIASMARKRFR